MRDADFRSYMEHLELNVFCNKEAKSEKISIRNGKLRSTIFGRTIGGVVPARDVFVVDYYGYMKKSIGLLENIEEIRSSLLTGKQLKTVTCPVHHFASLKIEYVAQGAPELVADFPKFKEMLLNLRGFKKEKKNG